MIPVGDDVRRRGLPVLTLLLVTANVAAFAIALARGFDRVVELYGFRPCSLLAGSNMTTLLTSLFLHGDLAHLLGNMVFLYIFGRSVEGKLSPLTYLLLYFAWGIAGALLHSTSLLLLPQSLLASELQRPLIGASGAISGVLGAYIVLFPRARILTLIPYVYLIFLRVPAKYYALVWFLYQLILGVVSLRYPLAVAVWAHIGGFAAGALTALVQERLR